MLDKHVLDHTQALLASYSILWPSLLLGGTAEFHFHPTTTPQQGIWLEAESEGEGCPCISFRWSDAVQKEDVKCFSPSLHYSYLFVCACTLPYSRGRGQMTACGSHCLLPCGAWVLNSSGKAWWQASWPTEPALSYSVLRTCHPSLYILICFIFPAPLKTGPHLSKPRLAWNC